MLTGSFPMSQLMRMETPFYYYDLAVLRRTLDTIQMDAHDTRCQVHYALRACATQEVLDEIARSGLGAACVSGGEVEAALRAGIPASKIILGGMAKQDREIRGSLRAGIFAFHVESVQELEIINENARSLHKVARVMLSMGETVRVGIATQDLEKTVRLCMSLSNIEFVGLHFYMGDRITEMSHFEQFAAHLRDLIHMVEGISYTDANLETIHARVQHIDIGGGLGLKYSLSHQTCTPDFKAYFDIFNHQIQLREDQTLHLELGRSVVAQCGSLITRVLYMKPCADRCLCVVDATTSNLLRPSQYGIFHRMENLSRPDAPEQEYDVVGPNYELGDAFIEGYTISEVHRGDLLAIRSAGAYGEIIAPAYNLRRLPGHVTSDELGFLSLGF